MSCNDITLSQRNQKEGQTKDDFISYIHNQPISKLETNITLHNGHSVHKQRYCVTRLNRQRKLVCFRYCAIFEHISSGSTTWPNSKCLFCHLIVRVCRSHVVLFKLQRVIFHPELSIHARYQNTSQLNILNITSVADINFTSFHKLNVCIFQIGSV